VKVATNMFGAETANLIIDAREQGLELQGIVCPFIQLEDIRMIVEDLDFFQGRILTTVETINGWKEVLSKNRPEWIIILKEEPCKSCPYGTRYWLIGNVNGRPVEIEIRTYKRTELHAKLFVYDKGFVVTSANLTSSGSLLRHIELGILVTQEDSEVEVKVVKRLFEHWWRGESRSCTSIRRNLKQLS